MSLSATVCVCAFAAPAEAKIYWTGTGNPTGVQRAGFDGTGLETLYSTVTDNFTNGIALDLTHGTMYWAQTNNGVIMESNINGSNPHIVVGGLSQPRGVAVDPVGGKIYFNQTGTPNELNRANLDGTGFQTIDTTATACTPACTVAGFFGYIALDLVNGKVYWTDSSSGNIYMANLTGTSVVRVVTGEVHPFGIAVDPAGGKIYWTNISGQNTVKSAGLNGSSPTLLVTRTGAGLDGGIAVDPTRGKLYWTETTPTPGHIESANLDGSSPTQVVASTIGAEGIALDPGDLKPVNTALPSVTGTGKVGQTETCNPGTWTGVGTISFAYRWGYVSGSTFTPITGATSQQYNLAAADAGKTVACQVTATDNIDSASANSAGAAVQLVPPPLVAGFGFSSLTVSGKRAKLPVFTNLAGTATIVASTHGRAKGGSSHKKHPKCKTRHASASIPSGRSPVQVNGLVRGCTYKLALTFTSSDGQVASDHAKLKDVHHLVIRLAQLLGSFGNS
jgi:sugar lactone lactonase YvrE